MTDRSLKKIFFTLSTEGTKIFNCLVEKKGVYLETTAELILGKMACFGTEVFANVIEEKLVTPNKKRKIETLEEGVIHDTLERASTSTSQFLKRDSPTEFELNPILQGLALRSVKVNYYS